jgi:hypothetical protein
MIFLSITYSQSWLYVYEYKYYTFICAEIRKKLLRNNIFLKTSFSALFFLKEYLKVQNLSSHVWMVSVSK